MMRFVVAVAASLAFAVACDNGPQSHVYVAMFYEAAGGCLDPSTTLGIVGTGDGSLLCAPTCLYQPSPPAVGGAKTWVSTMCGPYPANFNTDGTDPSCAPALLAYANGAACGAASDAGTDGETDGGSEASRDTGSATDGHAD
jgi:hypothetical protein